MKGGASEEETEEGAAGTGTNMDTLGQQVEEDSSIVADPPAKASDSLQGGDGPLTSEVVEALDTEEEAEEEEEEEDKVEETISAL